MCRSCVHCPILPVHMQIMTRSTSSPLKIGLSYAPDLYGNSIAAATALQPDVDVVTGMGSAKAAGVIRQVLLMLLMLVQQNICASTSGNSFIV